jgi:hypothetical protein
MTISRRFFHLLLIASGCLLPALVLHAAPPAEPPKARELREEQRIILNAYIIRGEAYLARSRDEFADSRFKASKENGFHAIELLARAKAKLDRHPERIEQVQAIFGGMVREDLRENLKRNIDPRYFRLQERLENVATQFAAKGDSSLQMTLTAAEHGNVARVLQDKAAQGLSAISSDMSDGGSQSGAGPSASSSQGGIANIPGSSVTQEGPNRVGIDIPGLPHVTIAGTKSADGEGIDSAQYGHVDLASGVKLPDGSVAFQTSKGVLVLNPDGSQNFIPGAKLNQDGSASLANGGSVSLANLRRDPSSGELVTGDNKRIDSEGRVREGGGGSTSGMNKNFTGRASANMMFVDEHGNPILVDPDWENGEQRGVRREYLGGKGARLVSETKVVRRIAQSSGNQFVVNVVPGESRSWKLSIATGETRNLNGNVQIALTLTDAGGLTDFTVKNWDAVSTTGTHAAVVVSPEKPNEVAATFSQDGDYEISVTGETGWGSPFRITGKSGIYR